MNNSKGITLIALIITIIILVILAAVSIRAVYNMGIVNHAVNGTQDYAKAAKEEEKTMQDTENFLSDAIGRIKDAQVDKSITAGKKATDGNKEYISGGYTAIIPEGWTISGKTANNDETTISTGLVIYYIDDKTDAEIAAIDWTDSTVTENLRKTYDQLVWIPMPRANINKMFMCQSEDGTNSCRITVNNGEAYCTTHSNNLMAGRLYATVIGDIFNASLTSQTYDANKELREPAIVTGNNLGTGTDYDAKTEGTTMTYLSQISNILGTRTDPNELYDSAAHFKTTLQNEYNQIVKSVYDNEGYWVGRYETSGMVNTDNAGTVKIIAGARNASDKNQYITNVTWYRMYAQQKKYAEGKGMIGGMIQGAAHDQMLMFADTDANYDIKSTTQINHIGSYYTNKPYETGGTDYDTNYTATSNRISYGDIANNIYDLEGNVYEFTTEAFSTYIRITRGGYHNYSYSASSRGYNSPDTRNQYIGTRQALYIK